MNTRLELVVSPQMSGERLDRALARQKKVGSRARAASLIEAGAVEVDGRPVRKSRQLKAGERIGVELGQEAPGEATAPTLDLEIVHEDRDLIVVDKPAGLVVHPGPGNRSGTLSQALAGKAAGGDPSRPGIVHRLDKETSGLLIVARSDVVLRALQRELRARNIRRGYTALVRGRPQSRTGTIDAPLGRDRRDPEKITVRAAPAREAVTHFSVLEEIGARTLLEVTLETGRTHQIRVHLAAIDLPVCGDVKYGIAGDLGLTRQFLHAGRLEFRHPVSGEPMKLASPLPDDLEMALKTARSER